MSLHGDMHCAFQNIKKHPATHFVGGDKLLRISTQEWHVLSGGRKQTAQGERDSFIYRVEVRSKRMKPAVAWGVVFLRKCISILPSITLSEKRAAGASRFVSTERGPCLLSIQPIKTVTISTLGLSLIKGSSKCCSASRRILAEMVVLALCRSSHTSFPRVSQNKPKKKNFKVQLVLSPDTFTRGERGPGRFYSSHSHD